MLCTVYKSRKKPGAYLYVAKRDNFDAVPSALMDAFGKPEFVMLFNLAGNRTLANADVADVRQHIEQHGFYLQLPKQDDGLFNSLSQIK